MRRIINNDLLTLASRLIVGIMLIYASYYKIIEPATFAKSIWYYHMVPGDLINLMALILPWLEMLCGLALILGIWYRGAVLWSNVLLLVFIVALASTIARGLSIDCGCFKAGKSATAPAWDALWFDLVAIVFALQMWFSRSRKWMLCASRND